MDHFAGLDISMDEIHVCVVDRDGAVVYEGSRHRWPRRSRTSWRKRRAVVESSLRPGRIAPILFHGLRELGFPVVGRLPGAQVAGDPQDRPQRCARAGAFGPHRVLQARACEVAAGSCTPLADHRAQKTGRPASNLGKSDPRFGGRVRSPALAKLGGGFNYSRGRPGRAVGPGRLSTPDRDPKFPPEISQKNRRSEDQGWSNARQVGF